MEAGPVADYPPPCSLRCARWGPPIGATRFNICAKHDLRKQYTVENR